MANNCAAKPSDICRWFTLHHIGGFLVFAIGILLFSSLYVYKLDLGRYSVPHKENGHKTTYGSSGQLHVETGDTFRRPDHLNGRVQLINNSIELNDYIRESQQPEICTLAYFKDSFVRSGHFYGRGAWYAPRNGSPSTEVEFFPEGCSFPTNLSMRRPMYQCVHAKHVKNILITGDSNARKTTQSLVSSLDTTDFKPKGKCEKIGDSRKSAKSYYAVTEVPEKLLEIKNCGFSDFACSSWQYECMVPRESHNSKSIRIEYIPMLHVLDGSMRIVETVKELEHRLLAADTKIEYLLRYYFPKKGFPDIWIYRPPFHHETWRNSKEKSAADIQYLLILFDMYLPNTTSVIFMSATPECPKKRSAKIGNTFKRKWNMSRNARLQEHNALWTTLLRPKVAARANYYVLFDAERLSCPIMCDWHVDGAHMDSVWYNRMVKYILAAYCLQ